MMYSIFGNRPDKKWYERIWRIFYESYYNKVYRIALSIVVDKELAKDITQEVFIHAFLKLDTLKDSEKFSAWISTIAKNLAKNARKQRINYNKKNISFYDMESNPPDSIMEIGEANNPEVLYEQNEAAKEVLKYIEDLDFEGQMILHMKFYEGLTYMQIAEQMNLKESTVRMKALRAKDKLSKKLTTHFE